MQLIGCKTGMTPLTSGGEISHWFGFFEKRKHIATSIFVTPTSLIG
jgi:hypothetical protein